MSSPLAYLNGRFVPLPDAGLAVHDAGFVAGATVVDNARTFAGRLFRWADHLSRLRRDCAACFVPLDPADDALTAAAAELLAHNAKFLPPGGELQLVTFATPGPLGVYTGGAGGPPTVGMVTYPVPFARYRPYFTDGATLAVVGAHPVSGETVLPPRVKHRSRMLWHVADHRARAATGNPAALGVPLDGPGGTVTETSVANLLAVVNGEVVSPPADRILDGISLRVTRELCGELGVGFAERELPAGGLAGASEWLLTGTGFGVVGVGAWHVGGDTLRFAPPGPVTRRLMAGWNDRVGLDIAGQITGGSTDTESHSPGAAPTPPPLARCAGRSPHFGEDAPMSFGRTSLAAAVITLLAAVGANAQCRGGGGGGSHRGGPPGGGSSMMAPRGPSQYASQYQQQQGAMLAAVRQQQQQALIAQQQQQQAALIARQQLQQNPALVAAQIQAQKDALALDIIRLQQRNAQLRREIAAMQGQRNPQIQPLLVAAP